MFKFPFGFGLHYEHVKYMCMKEVPCMFCKHCKFSKFFFFRQKEKAREGRGEERERRERERDRIFFF